MYFDTDCQKHSFQIQHGIILHFSMFRCQHQKECISQFWMEHVQDTSWCRYKTEIEYHEKKKKNTCSSSCFAVFLFLLCFIFFCSAANAIEISLANFQNAAGKKNVLWNHLKIISACKIHPKKEIVDMTYSFFFAFYSFILIFNS